MKYMTKGIYSCFAIILFLLRIFQFNNAENSYFV